MDSDLIKGVIGRSAMTQMDEWSDPQVVEDFQTFYAAVRVFARRQADRGIAPGRVVGQACSLAVGAAYVELHEDD